MSRLIINGKRRISGEIVTQGAKNAALPILAASVLAGEECVIHNCPRLRDVDKTNQVLSGLGCEVRREGNTVVVDPAGICSCSICDNLMRAMRSSIIFLGAILARCGEACVSMPGGCPIGIRPIDLHLKALREMGAEIREEHGCILCGAKRLHGADIHLDFPSVGATENIMLAAVTAKGTTTISNAAREPEIADLAAFLNAMGARIRGAGGSFITVEGREKLHGAEHSVMPDRIAAATYLAAAAVTRGEILLTGADERSMGAMLHTLTDMGARIRTEGDKIRLKADKRLKNISILRTMPYPGFPTDIQSPFMALAATAEGTGVFVETIFENRFRHVEELIRMGADISVCGRSAVVRGTEELHGARVSASELRGGAALVIAALGAEGRSEIDGACYIDRGYEAIEERLAECNADIRRI